MRPDELPLGLRRSRPSSASSSRSTRPGRPAASRRWRRCGMSSVVARRPPSPRPPRRRSARLVLARREPRPRLGGRHGRARRALGAQAALDPHADAPDARRLRARRHDVRPRRRPRQGRDRLRGHELGRHGRHPGRRRPRRPRSRSASRCRPGLRYEDLPRLTAPHPKVARVPAARHEAHVACASPGGTERIFVTGVTPDYALLMNRPIASGRGLTDDDRSGAARSPSSARRSARSSSAAPTRSAATSSSRASRSGSSACRHRSRSSTRRSSSTRTAS